MKKCRKCGTENPLDQQTNCPKCGIDYAKYEKHLAEKKANERLGQQFEKEIERGDGLTVHYDDAEKEIDEGSYYWIDLLIWAIVVLAFVVGGIELWFCLSMWEGIASLAKIPADGKFAIGLIILFIVSLSVSCILAIAGVLHLCRDIANNTRASRAYLRVLTHRKQG